MKVLLVLRGNKNSLYGGGGAERRFGRVVQFLNNDNIKIICNKEMAINFLKSGVIKDKRLLIYPEGNMGILKFNIWLINKIKVLKPDVIHLVLIQKSLLPFYIALKTILKEFSVVLSIAWTKYLGSNIEPNIRILSRLLFSRAQLIDLLYPSAIKSSILRPYLKKVRITPCSFTDYNEFKSAKKENVVTFVGRLIKEKRPFLFLEVIRILRDRYPDVIKNWKFIILGDGYLKRKIMDYIERNNLSDLVFTSSSYSSKEILKKSKIFVTLQILTNYPSQALIEAMACENAVIATKDDDTLRLVTSETGIIVNDDPYEIAEALRFLMINENLIVQKGKEARKKVIEEHRLDIFAEYLINLWKETILNREN
ncbi:MAG: hypothetical protein C0196_03510 [Dictyoglomus turgidum]|nr:MAG: hypothetical protein C0196_03510 [Dictyoglomus turgidum]